MCELTCFLVLVFPVLNFMYRAINSFRPERIFLWHLSEWSKQLFEIWIYAGMFRNSFIDNRTMNGMQPTASSPSPFIFFCECYNCTLSSSQCRKLTIHLSLLGENDFPPSAWWVDGKCFLETLLDIGTPDAFGISRGQVFLILKENAWQENI